MNIEKTPKTEMNTKGYLKCPPLAEHGKCVNIPPCVQNKKRFSIF